MAPSGAEFDLCPSKLAAPRLRRGALRRSSLIARVRAGGRFVSVVAPAGYGKTTLLAQWAARDKRPFAWVSLDDADNDPVVLLTYVASALHELEPLDRKVFRGVAAGAVSLWSTAMPRLSAALASVSRPVVLVLDDVHHVHDPAALDAVEALALAVPTGSQLVLAGRDEVSLPLARFRAEGELVEVGPADLALSDAEASALLSGAGVELSEDEARTLNARAEGWAAGLYLAALSFQASNAVRVDEFAGDDRFVADYVRAEHLSHLEADEIDFLTRTSVLDRMTAPLCDSVLERTDSAEVLSRLEHTNLFVVALDHHSGWYRYHHLFQDMLRAELARREPEKVAGLHRRAAAWCELNALPDRAIEHSLAAGDLDSAARVVAANTFPYYRTGRAATVERWLEAFDDPELLGRFPAVAVFGSYVLALRGLAETSDRWALAVETSPYEGPMPDGSASLRPWAAVVRARVCRDGVERMLSDADLAVAELHPQSSWLPIALMLRGVATLLGGDRDEAERMLELAAEAAAVDGATHAGMVAQSELALLALERGELDAAERAVATARAAIAPDLPGDYTVTALLHAASARVALARGWGKQAREDLIAAHRLRPMLNRALSWFAVQTSIELAKAHLALSDADGARALCLDVDDLLHSRPQLGSLVDDAVALREQLASFSAQPTGWPSTLTTAELRLLPLLTTHLSFREIAERLFVSRNTVKTQAISIYRKLDATSRSEAIQRAIELGLVDGAVAARSAPFTPAG